MKAQRSNEQTELWPTREALPTFEAEASSALGLPADRALWRDRFGLALREWQEQQLSRKPTVLSLFSGAGGLDIGFHDAGFEIVQMVELESDFVATLRANLGPGRYFPSGDPRCIDVRDYRAPFGEVDFVIGGPPCQTFSAAGRRASGVEGTNEARGMLFAEYARLLGDLQPRGFLFENVYGMTGAENGRSMAKVVDAFERIGYRLHLRILDAADYGVPQHRERLFIVGLREGGYRFPAPTHGPDSPGAAPYCTAGEALAGCDVDESEPLSVNGRHGHLLAEIPPGLNYSFFTEKLGHPNPIFAWRSKFSDYLYKADPNEPARTIKAQGGQYTGPFHWSGRRFTVGEFKRLQSFPDAYRFHGGRQRVVQQIGNSVPPQLGRILACSVLAEVFGERLPFALPALSPEAKLGFRKRKRLRTAEYQEIARSHLQRMSVAHPPRSPVAQNSNAMAYGTRGSGYDFVFDDKHSRDSMKLEATLTEESWSICVSGADGGIATERWTLEARPLGLGGTATLFAVQLSGGRLGLSQLACAWRFLERLLVERRVRDDLVQWFGYYQYRPGFALSLATEQIPERSPELRFIDALANGEILRRNLPEAELRQRLGDLGKAELRELLLLARAEGFDIRTPKTNPQIPKGHLLVPYPFPTLNGLSVTGRKAAF
jgi:DNA (cytosine-5)-methyltransferase 1